MSDLELLRGLIGALNDLEIGYMLVGSLSSNAYGIARDTHDADFVIQTGDRVGELRDRLRGVFDSDPQLSFETITMTTKHVFHHKGTGFRVELFVLSEDEHDRERFGRRVKVELAGLEVWLPTVEDVVIQKVRWGRGKDLLDAADVIAVSGEGIDWGYVEVWCDRLGCRARLEKARAGAWEG